MKQDCDTIDLVELGCVSTDTKGGNWLYEDTDAGMSLHPGMSDD